MSGRVAGNTPKIASKIVGAQHKSETNVREMSGKCLAEILHQKPSILWAGSKNLGFQDRRRKEKIRKTQDKSETNVREMSGKCPGNVWAKSPQNT